MISFLSDMTRGKWPQSPTARPTSSDVRASSLVRSPFHTAALLAVDGQGCRSAWAQGGTGGFGGGSSGGGMGKTGTQAIHLCRPEAATREARVVGEAREPGGVLSGGCPVPAALGPALGLAHTTGSGARALRGHGPVLQGLGARHHERWSGSARLCGRRQVCPDHRS